MTGGTVLLALGFCLAAVIAWRRRAWRWVAGLGALAAVFVWAVLRWLAEQVSWLGLLGIAAVAALLVWHRWSRTAGSMGRWNRRSRRKDGVASGTDVWRKRREVRALATKVRPSLSALSRRQLAAMPTAACAVRICRVGPQTVWTSSEGVVVLVGGPRFGKSSTLADQGLDAPGALLVTSTKKDLLELIGPLRAKVGPVVVFDPAGITDHGSTIGFDPLTGCEDSEIAVERATDMIPPNAGGAGGAASADRETWNEQARRVLAGLLHAAALGGHTMLDVQRWTGQAQQGAREVPTLLRRSVGPAFEQDLVQFFATNDRTRTSITSSIMPALGWLTHRPAARSARPGARFDVEWLLRARATVVLLGAKEARTTALVSALTGHIAREAKRVARRMPGERLDPPLRMCLDEATNICPVPLPEWTSSFGSHGISMVIACQSRAQLVMTYGPQGAAAIINNADTCVIYGGCTDRDDLLHWSTRAGERDEWVTSYDQHGRGTHRSLRRVPVIQPSQIASLPKHRVLVFAPGIPPVLGWGRRAWRRPDVRPILAHQARCKRLRDRRRPVPAVRVACGRWVERGLAAAAGQFPDRFADRARRRHEYNALRERLDLVSVRRARQPRPARPAGPAGPGDPGAGRPVPPPALPGRTGHGSGRWS